MLTRQKEFYQWLIGGFMTSSIIVGTVYVTDHHTQIIASINSHLTNSNSVAGDEKLKTLNLRSPASQPEGKGGGQMEITLTSPNSSSASASDPLIIKGHVHAMADLNDLRFEWILPAGLTPVNGMVSGELGNLSDGTNGDIEISLYILPGSENKQIHLQVYRLIGGERMGQVAQYNTLETKDSKNVEVTSALMRVDGDEARASSEKPRMMQ